jgi:hypothetical protein
MTQSRPVRVLVVTDKADPTPALTAAISHRAASGEVRFRVVVLNPARAELHLLHPERHDKALEAEQVLLGAMSDIEAAAAGRVIGSVSVRHDPMDAIEETIFSEPVDEIILSVPAHGVSTWLHQDLQSRLKHFGLPITVVAKGTAT